MSVVTPHDLGSLLPNLPEEYRSLITALTPPREQRQQWRELFDRVIAAEKTALVTPQSRLALQTSADAVGWLWFAEAGDPLPNSLVLRLDPNASGKVSPDNVMLAGRDAPLAGFRDWPTGIQRKLTSIVRERETFFVNNSAQITDALANVIRAGPQYRMLRALSLTAPSARRERALRNEEFDRRLAYERDTILRGYGLAEGAPLPPDPMLRELLNALPARIARETGWEPARGPTASAKVNSWILRQAQDWWPNGQRSGPVIQIVRLPGKAFRLEAVTSHDEHREITPDLDYWSQRWGYDSPPPLGANEFGRYLATTFLVRFYNGDNTDIAGCLERSVQEHAENEFFANVRSRLNWINEQELAHLSLLLRDVREPIHLRDTNTTNVRWEQQQPRSGITVSSREEIERELNQTVGHVLYRDSDRDPTRLVIPQPHTDEYPEIYPRLSAYDLVIEFSDGGWSANEMPNIPGFTTVARTGNRWAFRRSGDDPYGRGDDVHLDPAGVRGLAATYRKIGLDDLADAVTERHGKRGHLTAAELERLIAAHSTYPLPGDSSISISEGDRRDLASFETHVRDGRLHVQCTGAAEFLAASLEQALPGCVSSTVGGFTLTADNRITKATHRQTALSHQGKLYLLDATPPAPAGFGLTDGDLRRPLSQRNRLRSGARWLTRRLAQLSLPEAPPKPDPEPPPAVDLEAHTAERAAAAAAGLEQQVTEILRCAYGGERETSAALRRLKPDDPIAIAWGAARDPDVEHVADVVRYLDLYLTADSTTRARVARGRGWNDDSELVKLLVDCLRPVADTAPASPEEAPQTSQLVPLGAAIRARRATRAARWLTDPTATTSPTTRGDPHNRLAA